MLKIIIVDDHELIRAGLEKLIDKQKDMVLVSSASSAEELFNILKTDTADIIVLDISLPDRSGIDVLKDLKLIKPEIPVLVLSMHPEDHYALRALRNGASGYITKGKSSREILDAIRKICSGGKYITISLGEHLAELIGDKNTALLHEKLSDREFQILCLMGDGKTSKEIAESLNISDNTVRTYRSRIYEKMKLKSNSELIHYVMQFKLLE